ncbi:MAG: glycosyltransferase family 2 protein [Methylobacterium sp.]
MSLDPAAPLPTSSRLAVGIATVGRADVTRRTLDILRGQTRRPDIIVVCAPLKEDVGEIGDRPDVSVVLGPRGLPRQRNAILDALSDYDLVVFFDDDFVPHPDYLAEVEHAHRADPGLAMTTGRVIRDGILGPGLSFEDAALALDREPEAGPPTAVPHADVYNGYGCNMSVDLALARRHGVRFDESLPLYAWWEDVDFSRRLAAHGRIVRVERACGVHLGFKSGRQSGVRLGYSQIANPIYLLRKGSCAPGRVAAQILRNVLANCAKAFRPEAYVDRRGRVRGNLRALGDLMRGRLSPVRILEL